MWFQLLLLALIALIGRVSCFHEGRIVNGTDSDVKRFPFIVSLRDSDGKHKCGSSIIAPRWILTAAHCVRGQAANKLSIQYSSTKISASGVNVIGIKRIIIHENYAPEIRWIDDIALLELEGSLIYNYKTLAPVTLPKPNFEIPQTSEGAPGILIGWGAKTSGGDLQTYLQEVKLKIFSDKECTDRLRGATSGDYHICSGFDNGSKGQGSGDSGGPLLYKDSIQLGIVSWSVVSSAGDPIPGVSTKVSHYINWINSHIN